MMKGLLMDETRRAAFNLPRCGGVLALSPSPLHSQKSVGNRSAQRPDAPQHLHRHGAA